MKKSELTQIIQIIEMVVTKEVRKQLPTIIAETFRNMMGTKTIVTENKTPSRESLPEVNSEPLEETHSEQVNLKTSLRELFAGTSVMTPPPQTRQPRQFTKDPILNEILNETTPDLRSREGLAGMAAFQGGYNPSAMASPMMPMESGHEPAFLKNIPTMNSPKHIPQLPIGNPPALADGQTSTHVPLSALPEGVSALDVARHGAAPASVAGALTRNYSEMLKLIDKKKGKAI